MKKSTEDQRRAAAQFIFGEVPSGCRVDVWCVTGINADDHTGLDLNGADDLADLLAEREGALRAGLSRITEAIQLQAPATALPRELLDVARGVLQEHPWALDRIGDLEKVCRKLQAERDEKGRETLTWMAHAAKSMAAEERLRAQLRTCRDVFDGYVDMHEAKGTADGLEKAAKNARIRDDIDRALAFAPGIGIGIDTEAEEEKAK